MYSIPFPVVLLAWCTSATVPCESALYVGEYREKSQASGTRKKARKREAPLRRRALSCSSLYHVISNYKIKLRKMHTRGNNLLLIEVSCRSVLIDKRMPYQGLLVFMKFIQLHGVGSEIIHLNEIKYDTWPSDVQAKAYYHFSWGRGVFFCLRACLQESGGPQLGEVTHLGGVTRLSM